MKKSLLLFLVFVLILSITVTLLFAGGKRKDDEEAAEPAEVPAGAHKAREIAQVRGLYLQKRDVHTFSPIILSISRCMDSQESPDE